MPRTKLPGDAQFDIRLRIADPPKPERPPVIPHPCRPEGELDPQFVGRVGDFADFSQCVPALLAKFCAELFGIDLHRVGGRLVASAPELCESVQLVVVCEEPPESLRDQSRAQLAWQRLYDQLPWQEKARVTLQEAWCNVALWLSPPRPRRYDLVRELPFLSRLAVLLASCVGDLEVDDSVPAAPILPPPRFWSLNDRGRKACAQTMAEELAASIYSARNSDQPYGFFIKRLLQSIPPQRYDDPEFRSVASTLEEELLFLLYAQYQCDQAGVALQLPPSNVLCAGTVERGSGRFAVLETRVAIDGGLAFRLYFVSPADAIKDESLRIRRVSVP